MPRGGKNRLPQNVTKLRGTHRGARDRNTPRPRPGAPSCPSWLSREAKAEWKRLAPKLEELGLLTVLDRATFAAYCQAYGHVLELEAKIAHDGQTVPGYRGATRKHPLLSALNQARQTMYRLAQEFGLTPASRARLDLPDPNPGGDDDFEHYLDRGKS